MKIGVLTVSQQNGPLGGSGVTASGATTDGPVARFGVTGPDHLNLTIIDSRWRNGERDIRVVEASGPPQATALENRLRLTVRPLGDGLASCDLRQARVKLNTEPFAVSLYRADATALKTGAGLDIVRSLTMRGAQIGERSDLIGDRSRHRRGLCCVFPQRDEVIPLVAFLTSRVLPVLNMWFAPTSCNFDAYRIPSRSRESAGRLIYVILLDKSAGSSPKGTKPPVYVGQTGKTRADRFREHKIGYRKSRHVQRHGLRLMPELYPRHVVTHSSIEAEAIEAAWAQELRNRGHLVFGGH